MSDEEMRAALMAVLPFADLNRCYEVADALLPAVRKIAAGHLRAAAKADDEQLTRWPGSSGQWLRDRADAMDPA